MLPVLVVSMVMSLLYAASKKKSKEDEQGNLILQLPKLYAVIGIVVIIGGMGLLIFGSFFAIPKDKIPVFIGSLAITSLGLFLFAKGSISNIKITEFGIVETTLFGKQKEIKWHEVKVVSFGNVSLELKIKSSDKKIRAHMHLVGFSELVEIIEEKTGKSRAEFGIPG